MRKLSHLIYYPLLAAVLLASCSPKVVVQRETVVVRDTVRIAVPYVPERDYAATWAGQTERLLDSLCESPLLKESQLGLCILDLTSGSVVYEQGARQRMRPASTMKIVTAVTAMSAVLDHPDAFTLRAWTDSEAMAAGRPTDLTLAGGMNPLLDYTGLCALADSLKARGVSRIADIRLDVSLADTTRWGEGWCWDDENEALTPYIYKSAAAARGGKGSSRLAWSQQPEAPFIADLRKALKSRGIKVSGTVERSTQPLPVQNALSIRTHTWDDILLPMMKSSNNQHAEAMLWQLGLLSPTPSPRVKQVTAPFDTLCRRLTLDPHNYRIADGSGRSLYNYVTPELLCVLLNYAATQPWYERFKSSLPIMGVDGTLRKRCHETTAENRVYAKTGTVTGVVSLAGYTTNNEGHLLCFAIINQGISTGSLGRSFQDEVCKILTRK